MNYKILITGGAGYVGCKLADKLSFQGNDVLVYDLFIYGENVFESKKIKKVKGDIRDINLFRSYIKGVDIVIHLACISNDPSFELNPTLGKEINLDAFEPLVKECKKSGVKRFIYASSSSVYGIKDETNVHEGMKLEPLTDYSKFKAKCEEILFDYKNDNFECTVIRPATVCGYSKRLRLDLVVNIFANIGFHTRKVKVFGGDQLRPNIHIDDMVRIYELMISSDSEKINGKIFNAGWENRSVLDIAHEAKSMLGNDIELEIIPTDDNRSYHISSEKIKNELNFKTKFTIADAIKDLKDIFENNKLNDPLNNENFYNIKKMQSINLK